MGVIRWIPIARGDSPYGEGELGSIPRLEAKGLMKGTSRGVSE
jgi:hypothetical protein